MIQAEDCFYLGYIKKTNGVRGHVEVMLDVDNPASYKKKESMLLMIKNNLTPFFIEQLLIHPNKILVKFKEINSANDAATLIGTSLYMPLTELPVLKGKKKFYYHEVIGFTAKDVNLGELGTITDIVDLTSQSVIQIRQGNKEILVPLIDEFLVSVDKENREMTLKTPEGLVEMYLAE